MSEKLLPCPFCGGEASAEQCVRVDYYGDWVVGCDNEQCCAKPEVLAAIKSAAIAAWNRRTPAPEGEVTRLLTYANSHKLPDEEPIGVTNLKWGDLRAFAGKPLYASPAVPVGSGEPVARATCQDCGGHIEGWICQSCDRQFRENDAGDLVFEDQPVVPVGVSRENLLKAVRPVLDRHPMIDSSQSHKLDIQAGWVADAILAALRPADTGANHD